jgi:beta-glucanase (GH16 family)
MALADKHVAPPDALALGYRFATDGWDNTVRGTALNLSGYTRTFHDHFTSISTVTDGNTGAGPWYAPAHITTSNAQWVRPGVTVPDTYTILPDNTTLQIKMQQINNTGTFYSGHIQSVDSWRNGFSQAVPSGGASYFEARMALNAKGGNATKGFVNPAPSWPAFWLYTILDARDSAATKCEIDVMEAYGDNLTSTKQLHMTAFDHGAYRPQSGNAGSFGGTITTRTPSNTTDVTKSPFNVVGSLFDGLGEGVPGTFHTYGLKIDETWITWYFDGLLVSRYPVYQEALGELFMLISLQSQDLSGTPNVQTYLWVDYVDCWVHS